MNASPVMRPSHEGLEVPAIKDEKLPSESSQTLVGDPPAESLDCSQDYDPCKNAKPYSPFYRHATPGVSAEDLMNCPPSKDAQYDNDRPHDIENPSLKQSQEGLNPRVSKLWVEKKRRCDYMRSLSTKQRLAVKGIIAIVTVGSMVAIALGITAAVGGGVWKSDHQQGPIKR